MPPPGQERAEYLTEGKKIAVQQALEKQNLLKVKEQKMKELAARCVGGSFFFE